MRRLWGRNCWGKHWLETTRHHNNHLRELFYDGGPGKEHRITSQNKGRIQGRSKGDTTCLPSLPESSSLECEQHQEGPGSERLARDDPETNPVTINPRLRVTGRSAPPGFPYPTGALPSEISFFVSGCVSSDSSFLSVRQEPTRGPRKGSHFPEQNHAGIPEN